MVIVPKDLAIVYNEFFERRQEGDYVALLFLRKLTCRIPGRLP